jgi:hypothetical protein
MAYFIYLECCEGSLDESWKNDEPMTMKRFRRRLSKQMCEYKCYREEYPGDEFLRTTTVRAKKRCGTKRKVSEAQKRTTEYEGGVTYEQYVDQVSSWQCIRGYLRGFVMMRLDLTRATFTA